MTDWNQAYASGLYDGRGEAESSPRFALIGGLCAQARATDILDVGCGTGLLRPSLRLGLSRYTGLDCSSVAIQRLQDKGGGDYICADAEQWIPSGHYDAIILNEVLYYFKDPKSILSKYYDALSPGGIFIVSIFNKRTQFWQPNPNRRALAVVEQFLPHASRYEVSDGKRTWAVVVCEKTSDRTSMLSGLSK
jgi:2-polyprenyl-3-methyl-5-hydroxy-6-metoxy-1,4-benzoquinol methylase